MTPAPRHDSTSCRLRNPEESHQDQHQPFGPVPRYCTGRASRSASRDSLFRSVPIPTLAGLRATPRASGPAALQVYGPHAFPRIARQCFWPPSPLPVMAASVIDSRIYRNIFGTEEARQLFSDESFVSFMIDVEAALARAQAACNVVPSSAAKAISQGCSVHKIK